MKYSKNTILEQNNLLFGLIAVLSVITGILNIGSTSLSGPLVSFIPLWIQQAAGFTGVMTGFLMIVTFFGLGKKLKVAWYAALLLLPLTALQGIFQSSIISYPLILLSIIELGILGFRRKDFSETTNLSAIQTATLISVITIQIYGVVGTLALNGSFTKDIGLIEAVYFTVVTSSTVGYGDIAPLTPEARLFTVTLVILGASSFAAAIGTFASPLIESQLADKFEKMEEDIIEEIIHEE